LNEKKNNLKTLLLLGSRSQKVCARAAQWLFFFPAAAAAAGIRLLLKNWPFNWPSSLRKKCSQENVGHFNFEAERHASLEVKSNPIW